MPKRQRPSKDIELDTVINLCRDGDMASTTELRELAHELGVKNAHTLTKRSLCHLFALLRGRSDISIELPPPPAEFMDPVTQSVFNDAWVNDIGHTYDHSTIDKLELYEDEKESYRRDPQTRGRIHSWAPNYALQGLLDDWKLRSGFYEEDDLMHNDIPEWDNVTDHPSVKKWIDELRERLSSDARVTAPRAPRATIVEPARPVYEQTPSTNARSVTTQRPVYSGRRHVNLVITMSNDWRIHEHYSATHDSIVVLQHANGHLRNRLWLPRETLFDESLFVLNDFNDDVRNAPHVSVLRRRAWQMAQSGVFSPLDFFITFGRNNYRANQRPPMRALYSDMSSLPDRRPLDVTVDSDRDPDGRRWRRERYFDIVTLLPDGHEQRERFRYDQETRSVRMELYYDTTLQRLDQAPSIETSNWFERHDYNIAIRPSKVHHSMRESVLKNYQTKYERNTISTRREFVIDQTTPGVSTVVGLLARTEI